MATYSEALKEALASAPVREIIYHTLELHHPAFTEPARLVQGYSDIDARLESDAPQDAGQIVTFIGAAWDFKLAKVAEGGVPELKLTFDNVSRQISDYLRLASESQSPVTARYRIFLDSQLLAGPQNDPPYTLEIRDAEAGLYRVECTAGMPDVFNSAFCRVIYTTATNPSLGYVS